MTPPLSDPIVWEIKLANTATSATPAFGRGPTLEAALADLRESFAKAQKARDEATVRAADLASRIPDSVSS